MKLRLSKKSAHHDQHEVKIVQAIDMSDVKNFKAPQGEKIAKIREDKDFGDEWDEVESASFSMTVHPMRHILVIEEEPTASFNNQVSEQYDLTSNNDEKKIFIGFEGELTEENLVSKIRPLFLTKKDPFVP